MLSCKWMQLTRMLVRNRREMRVENSTTRRVARWTPDDASITAQAFREKTQVPLIVVESAEDTECEVLRDIYVRKEKGGLRGRVKHLLLLCWSIKAGKLCCTLEQYQSTNERGLQMHGTFVWLEITRG